MKRKVLRCASRSKRNSVDPCLEFVSDCSNFYPQLYEVLIGDGVLSVYESQHILNEGYRS